MTMRSGENTARRHRIPAAALLALACASLLSLASPAASGAAGEYEVEICTQDAKAGDQIGVFEDGGFGIHTFPCVSFGESMGILQEADGTAKGGEHWTLRAPPGTRIHELDAFRFFSASSRWSGGLEWRLVTGPDAGFRMLDHLDEFSEPPFGDMAYEVDSESVTGRMLCVFITCESRTPLIRLNNAVVVMEDLAPPTVTAEGTLLESGPMRGVREASFVAGDQGSGVAEVALLVDGAVMAKQTDENEGRCKEPYRALAPCKGLLESRLSLDTSRVEDGEHVVRLAAIDASGQVELSPRVTITIHNAPTSTVPPSISGTARLGSQLTAGRGEWEGRPTSFSYRWLQCEPNATKADANSCAPISGATQPTYQPQPDDVYLRLAVEVTARNRSGPESALSAPSAIVPDAHGNLFPGGGGAPVLSHVSLSRRRFRVGVGRPPLAIRRVGKGSVLRYSSSEAGTLGVQIAPAQSSKGGRARGSHLLVRRIQAGRGRMALSGRIGGRPLPPGRYLLTAAVFDRAGNASKPSHLAFTIVPG
jgi:hypothetical protein